MDNANFIKDNISVLRVRSIENKVRSMESRDNVKGKETGDCTMAAFRCRGQMAL